jgi:uncharacterized protein (TIGR02118 family)
MSHRQIMTSHERCPQGTTNVVCMPDRGVVNGRPGVVAETSDVGAARALASELAGIDAVDAVAVHIGKPGEPVVLRATGPVRSLTEAASALPDAAIRETRSRHLRRHRVGWALGEASPGVSVVYRVRRHRDLDPAAFHDHWERTHAPIALRHHMGMWDYEQVSAVADDGAGDGVGGFDGLAIVQFAVAEDLRDRFFDGPEGLEVISADAASFTDSAATRRQRTIEEVFKVAAVQPSTTYDAADHRSLNFTASCDEVWATLGDFSAFLDWWPSGFVACDITPGDPITRTLTRNDGSAAVESLLRHDDGDHMFQLAVIQGLPAGIGSYTCRYELRETPDGCRLDWSPRAIVRGDAWPTLGAMVDRGWERVSAGLGAVFSTVDPVGER